MSKENPPGAWSNLTEAIQAGEPIDYESLDGMRIKCVNPNDGEYKHILKRDRLYPAHSKYGWKLASPGPPWGCWADGWYGLSGWVLYIQGDIPLQVLPS